VSKAGGRRYSVVGKDRSKWWPRLRRWWHSVDEKRLVIALADIQADLKNKKEALLSGKAESIPSVVKTVEALEEKAAKKALKAEKKQQELIKGKHRRLSRSQDQTIKKLNQDLLVFTTQYEQACQSEQMRSARNMMQAAETIWQTQFDSAQSHTSSAAHSPPVSLGDSGENDLGEGPEERALELIPRKTTHVPPEASSAIFHPMHDRTLDAANPIAHATQNADIKPVQQCYL